MRNVSFTAVRRAATFVTSTSTTVVSCAVDCIETTARSAMTLRRRDMDSLVPRSGEASRGFRVGALEVAVPPLSAASSTSCLRMRPPTPVPDTVERSTPRS